MVSKVFVNLIIPTKMQTQKKKKKEKKKTQKSKKENDFMNMIVNKKMEKKRKRLKISVQKWKEVFWHTLAKSQYQFGI